MSRYYYRWECGHLQVNRITQQVEERGVWAGLVADQQTERVRPVATIISDQAMNTLQSWQFIIHKLLPVFLYKSGSDFTYNWFIDSFWDDDKFTWKSRFVSLDALSIRCMLTGLVMIVSSESDIYCPLSDPIPGEAMKGKSPLKHTQKPNIGRCRQS